VRDLEPDEKRLHESLHPDVARVLSGKGLLRLKRMLEESGYADSELSPMFVLALRYRYGKELSCFQR
jgi:hypothetical protein